MKILIVEDDPPKLTNLKHQVHRLIDDYSLSCAGSLQEAMEAVSTSEFDLVLLDMAIPSHPSGPGSVDTYSQPVGGLDVLMYLSFSDSTTKVIIVTQYPNVEYNNKPVLLRNLQAELSLDGIDNVIGVVFFSEDSSWISPLEKIIRGTF